ncbi:MAG TPA: HAMP domain-containing sensor histidine kinase [Bacteroidales bacterium]|nr:HAMP domain-containing sensor histidine kinase [Bacteroidales bacterium]
MKRSRPYGRILILMIISQLLLTGFVFQWLRSQYMKQRMTLQVDLKHLYLDSQEEMIDSLLISQYVEPVLADSSIHYLRLNEHLPVYGNIDSALKNINTYHEASGRIGKAFITVDIKRDSLPADSELIDLRRSGLNEEMLLRSIRLIIEQSDDSAVDRNGYFWFKNAAMIDTIGFKRSYKARLDEGGMDFNINWMSISPDAHINFSGKELLIQAGLVDCLPAVSVTHYQAYLLGKIFPQIIFAIVLTLLTASAFVIAYQSLRRQAQLNAIRNDFISNITHELKTPISTVKVVIESLRRYDIKKDKAKSSEYLNLASLETQRLEDLINKVLDQSFMEESGHQIDLKIINLQESIQGVLDSMKPRLEAEAGSITFAPGEGDFNIKGDELYIQGVLINLIDNSLKYADRAPEIEIGLFKSGTFVCIEVKDNGPGIPEKYQKKIFEKFFRIPANDVHNVKGYGLGLSFSSLVMNLHKGYIDVKNLKEGCLFTLKFPIEKSE